MGVFRKTVRLSNIWETTVREVEAYIDTGSHRCQVSEDMARELQLVPMGEIRIRYADGREATRPLTLMRVELVGLSEMVSVQRTIIGPPGSEPLLGAYLLEDLGLGIDPVDGRLIPEITLMLARLDWPTV